MRRLLFRVAAGLAFIWVLLVAWGFAFAWRRVPEYTVPRMSLTTPPLTGAQYEALIDSHARPYVVEITVERGGGILLYGAEHTRDPADPTIADIRSRWDAFGPTAALVESRLGIMFPGIMDPVRTFGEPGAVHALARRAGVPTWTWEPPYDVWLASLLSQGFSEEQVALRVAIGRYASNRRFGRPDDPEALVDEVLRSQLEGSRLSGVLPDMAAFEAAWARHFPADPDWRDVSDEYGLPGFLGEIDTNRARDDHFAAVIIDLVRRGERVFAIAGSSHAVKLEPALRDALTRAP